MNGSDDNGYCGDRNSQLNGLRVCEDPNGIGFTTTKSVLVDGTTPTLDFSDDNWAEGFFTVNRNDRTMIELGFDLDINVIITRVELESLECPERGIGTSTVSLFGMEDPGGVLFPTFGSGTATLLDTITPEATSCSVQTHTFCIPMGEQPYRYYYLAFTFSNSDIDWLFLAEVTFLVNSSSTPTTTTTVTPPPPSSRTTSQPHTPSQPHIPSRTSQPQVATSQYLIPTPNSSNPATGESGSHSDPSLVIILAGGIGVSLLLMVTVVVLSIITCYLAVFKKRRKIGAKDDDHSYEDIVNFRGGKDIEVVNPVYAMIAEKGERPNVTVGIQLEKNRAYGHSDSKPHIYCDCK